MSNKHEYPIICATCNGELRDDGWTHKANSKSQCPTQNKFPYELLEAAKEMLRWFPKADSVGQLEAQELLKSAVKSTEETMGEKCAKN